MPDVSPGNRTSTLRQLSVQPVKRTGLVTPKMLYFQHDPDDPAIYEVFEILFSVLFVKTNNLLLIYNVHRCSDKTKRPFLIV